MAKVGRYKKKVSSAKAKATIMDADGTVNGEIQISKMEEKLKSWRAKKRMAKRRCAAKLKQMKKEGRRLWDTSRRNLPICRASSALAACVLIGFNRNLRVTMPLGSPSAVALRCMSDIFDGFGVDFDSGLAAHRRFRTEAEAEAAAAATADGLLDMEEADTAANGLPDMEESDTAANGLSYMEEADTAANGLPDMEEADTAANSLLDMEEADTATD